MKSESNQFLGTTIFRLTDRARYNEESSSCASESQKGCVCRYPLTQRVQEQDQNKLLELTAQCINYYNRYSHEKDTHSSIVKKAFQVLKGRAQQTFAHIVAQAERKLQEIKSFLNHEENRMVEEKNKQEQHLNTYLKEIKEVHLTKLLRRQDGKNQGNLSQYAHTLQSFFSVMTEVQKDRFQDKLEECVEFISNLVKEEVDRLLTENYPLKMQDLMAARRSCDPEFTFEHKNSLDIPDSFLQQIERNEKQGFQKQLEAIRIRQEARRRNMEGYSKVLVFHNQMQKIVS